ncbi:ATP-binding cassette domain-containing protein [Breoghania sp. L-A4]|uniref:ATP-binding cassette domain-containing protein n=1 Tax=Breoghania sp. L-A4 TaxID=2304600 RepID=UPI0013C2D601|nr:ATP-binding cassette domain-containing protein [Breoghania sp. L-A4]
MTFIRLIFGHRTLRRSQLVAWLAVATLSTMAAVALLGSMVGTQTANGQPRTVDLSGLALFMLIAVLMVLSQYKALDMTMEATEAAVDMLRRRFSHAIRFADPQALERIGSARLFATMTRVTTVVEEAGSQVIYGLITGALMLLVGVYVLFVSPLAFAVLAFFGGGTVFLYRRRRAEADPALEAARDAEKRYLDLFVQLLDGRKEVRFGSAIGEDLVDTYLSAAEAESHARKSFAARQVRIATILAYSGFYLLLAAMVFALPQYLAKEAEVGKLVLSTLFLLLSVNVLMRALPVLSRANVALDDLNTLMRRLGPIEPDADELAGVEAFEELRLTDLQPRTGGPRFSASLKPGGVTAIVGGNGSGKTLLLKVLCGLHRPVAGSLSVDGTALEDDHDWAAHQSRCAAVFQDGHLFDRFYGLDGIDDAALEALVAEMGIGPDVLGAGREIHGERLSPLLRRRLLVAGAVLADKPLVLFDDILSGQDRAFCTWFAKALVPRLRARGACVVITAPSADDIGDIADQTIRTDGPGLQGAER